MLIEVDYDTYNAIEEQYDCGIKKRFDDDWETHYYVEEVLLDMYESHCLLIVEQENWW